jgi:hypothetical protein
MTILTFPLQATDAVAQQIATPGGVPNASYLYIGFQSAPSAGTVLIEGLRPGSTTWTTIYNGTAFGAQRMCDGGYGPLRVTFIGLTGGSSPSLSIVPAQTVMFPSVLYTDGGFGPYSRLRVDVDQTSFWQGLQYRSFREINIPSGTTEVIKVVVPVNTVLFDVSLTLDASSVRLRTLSGGTAGGTFGTILPVLRKSTMTDTPVILAQNSLSSGGTHSGGSDIDVIRLVVAGATAQQSSVGSKPYDQRGVGPGTYYWRLENIGNAAATGVFSCWWEERP